MMAGPQTGKRKQKDEQTAGYTEGAGGRVRQPGDRVGKSFDGTGHQTPKDECTGVVPELSDSIRDESVLDFLCPSLKGMELHHQLQPCGYLLSDGIIHLTGGSFSP